ncbi:hypothetical protein, partial [Microvirga arabica]
MLRSSTNKLGFAFFVFTFGIGTSGAALAGLAAPPSMGAPGLRIPMKPDAYSKVKPDTHSDFIPDSV